MWQVIGQNRVISVLQRCLERGTLAHAYLLAGPPHVGKMTLAVNLAQALNCEAGERPCLQCASCQKIAAGHHSDVQIIGITNGKDSAEAKLIGIDQIKQMQHSASLPPFEGKHKVFIIDNAELLSTEAANCLLKTLEEPADKVSFILLTLNDKLLLPTVISRCQRFELTPLSIEKVAAALTENLSVEPERARLLAGLSHGCLGWAISAGTDASLLQQRDEELNKLLSIMASDHKERFDYAARMASQFSQKRKEVYDVLTLWLDFWRDLMLVKTGHEELVANSDRSGIMREMAGSYRLLSIKYFIDRIRAAAGQLSQNANPRLVLETLMLDIPEN
jgi:DNA polymerase-3 subunit delta'